MGYFLFLLSRIPSADEVVEVGIGVVDSLSGIVGDALCAEQFAVGVVDGDHLADDFHPAAVAVDDGLCVVGFGFLHLVALVGSGAVVLGWVPLVHLDGTIPIGVGKEACHVAKVHDMEIGLALLLTDASAAPDDLFKLGHRVDILVKDDEFHHLAVDTCRKELTGGGNDGIGGRDGSEIVELAFAIFVGASDTHHVVGVLLAQVGVFVDQGDAHPLGVGFVGTEDDGLAHPVGLLEVLRYFVCHFVDAVFDDEVVVVVGVVVYAVFDDVAKDIALAFGGSPSVADIGHDVDDLKGG